MKNKGFTLIEIIGTIIIIGILTIIAIVTFSGSMKGFREDYYTETVRTLTESGKEFFNDNRKYRPSEVLGAQIVPMSTLISQKYLDEVNDYKGNKCSNNSYVIVIKNGKDDYEYHACLVCAEDDYSNMSDKYCDAAWQAPTQIEYVVATPPNIYIYKGTPRESLDELLAIKASYVKKNAKGEILGIVDGTGFDEAPTIYPENADIVDTNKTGRYELDYVYNGNTIKGSVTVYEYLRPNLKITKEENMAIDLKGRIKTETGDYSSGEWTQKIYVTLTPGLVDAGGADISSTNIKNIVNRFQWNKDGVWQDFCGGDNCEEIKIETEMNEDIKFRSIDIDEKISDETTPITIRIDNTKPTCSLETIGEHKENEWFTSDVAINFVTNKDLVKTSSESVSEVRVSNITIETGEFQNTETILSTIHNYDINEVTYIGYVEDNAKNFTICNTTFKRDASDPICTIAKSNTRTTNGVTLTVTCSDVGPSGCNASNSETGSSNLTAGTYTYTVHDIAGNSGICSETVYAQDQSSDRSCNTAGRCENAGCETWKQCERCAEEGWIDVPMFNASSSQECYNANGTLGNNGTCYTVEWGCKRYEKYDCECTLYYKSIEICGCASWSNYGSWYDVSSCTENTSNYVMNNNICRVIYY